MNFLFSQTEPTVRKSHASYNNILRMVIGCDIYCNASQMFVYNNLLNCAAVVRNLIYRFIICQLQSSENILTLSIINSEYLSSYLESGNTGLNLCMSTFWLTEATINCVVAL